MATNDKGGKKPKPTRESDDRALDRNNRRSPGNADDRLLGLSKLVGRKPPKPPKKS